MRFILRLLAAGSLACCASISPASSLKVGQPAPDFELVLMDGSRVHLSELRGQVVLVNFWATWCAPCRAELPLLNNYYNIAQQRGWPLRVFAVTTEDSAPASQLKPLFQVLQIPSAKRVRGGALSDVDAVPTNYVIDKSGVLRYAKAGSFDLDGLNEVLVPLLQQPVPTPAP